MAKFHGIAKLMPSAILLTACGAPEIGQIPGTAFPSKWTTETLWKNFEIQKKPKLTNFLFENGQSFFSATSNGTFEYTQREAPSNLSLIGDAGFTGNGADFSWETSTPSSDNWAVTKYNLLYNHIPVDSVEVKKVAGTDGSLWVNGQVPEFALSNNGDIATGEFFLSQSEAQKNSPAFLQDSSVVWSNGEATYFAGPASLTPAWRFIISPRNAYSKPNVPTEIILSAISGEVLKTRPLAAHVDGSALMFNENSVTDNGVMTRITLPYIQSTTLKSPYWQVKNCMKDDPANGKCSATASGPTFDYALSDNRYDEVVAYHSVARSWDWNQNIMNTAGLSADQRKDLWGSDRPQLGLSTSKVLTIYVRALTKTATGSPTFDNAQYLPGGVSGTEAPAIVVGTGWEPDQGAERTLRYLGKDADVVMHEFHHHIIFRSLTSTSGETGAMHEGLADFFTYSITGNNKLGESIVPSSYSKGALRAANVSGTIKNFVGQPVHIAGEFWSTVLWDVRTALGVGKNGKYKTDKIVWDAIDLAVSAETYYGFIGAMAKATDAYASVNGDNAVELRKAMFKVFSDRGFLASTSADGTLPSAGLYVSTSQGVPLTTATAKKTSSKGICGSVANNNSAANWASIVLIVMTSMLPYALSGKKIHTEKIKISRFPRRFS